MNTTDKIMALATNYAKTYTQIDMVVGEKRAALRTEIEALVRERDEADQRAGAAERRLGKCMNSVRQFELERSQMKAQEKQS